MSLTRKFLSAMGIEDDKAEQIISAHLETVDPLKKERDEYKAKADQFDGVQKELNATKQKLQGYEDPENKDSWKVKYDALAEEKKTLQKEYDDYKADVSAKELTAQKREAYRNLLKSAGVSEKRLDSILKVSDFNSIELEDGKIKDEETLTNSIKDEWSDFIGTESKQGAGVPNPPVGGNNINVRGVTQSRAAQLAARHHESLYGGGNSNKEE